MLVQYDSMLLTFKKAVVKVINVEEIWSVYVFGKGKSDFCWTLVIRLFYLAYIFFLVIIK